MNAPGLLLRRFSFHDRDMELSARKIIVVGAGIGGLAVARALALRGAEVTVLEQADAIREVGAGLQISPNGFAVLQALGLGQGLHDTSVRGQAVSLRDYRKGEVLRLELNQLEKNAYYFVHRADLIELLAQGARAAGVQIRLLQEVRRIVPGAPARAELSNGAVAEADLVIGADGLHSKLRPELNGASDPFFTGQVAWRAVVPADGTDAPEARLYMAPHRHLVCYPMRGGQCMNVVAIQERAAWVEESWNLNDDPDSLRAAFADFGAEAQGILGRIDEVYLWGLFRHPVARHWVGEGVALLGDAAHPTLPFMAQGANMALEDAWVLADRVSRGGDLADALAAYEAKRRPRASRVIETANRNAWKYHLSFGPVRWGAHLGLRAVGAVAPGAMLRQFDWIYGHDVTRET